MNIRVGLSTNDLTNRLHQSVAISSNSGLVVEVADGISNRPLTIEANKQFVVSASDSVLVVHGARQIAEKCQRFRIRSTGAQTSLCIQSLLRSGVGGRVPPCYTGEIEICAVNNQLRLILICDLDSYLRGVLESEMPAHYHAEAIKAQAVTARTYGLHPRVDHGAEGFNVCDSFLCCQNFIGNASTLNQRYAAAISATHNQILSYADRPVLALFSSCAGGHTEDYENCFSDLKTNKFPPEPLPYLRGVPEGGSVPLRMDEQALRSLWHSHKPDVADSWSPHFRWKVEFTAEALESHMHHVIIKLMANRDFSPFIEAPSSGQFGHINGFIVDKRGSAATAISLLIITSTGTWKVSKELVIRSVFQNADIKLARLRSARIFFEETKDELGLLAKLTVYGLGWGHGVGLQQTGAQGHALAGRDYRQILSHYFSGAVLQTV